MCWGDGGNDVKMYERGCQDTCKGVVVCEGLTVRIFTSPCTGVFWHDYSVKGMM